MILATGTALEVIGFAVENLPKANRRLRDLIEKNHKKNFGQRRAEIRNGMLIDVVQEYYRSSIDEEPASGFQRYSVEVHDNTVSTSIVAKPEWVGLQCPADEISYVLDSGKFDQAISLNSSVAEKRTLFKTGVTKERRLEYLAPLEASESEIWNDPVYRLWRIDADPQLKVSFTTSNFYSWRFEAGLMLEELVCGLISSNLNPTDVVRNRSDLLPLRELLLRSPARFEDYPSWVCAGGVPIVLAMSHDDNGYFIPIQKRSKRVDGGHNWSVVPMGFHGWQVDEKVELSLKHTVFRELYEELFGGNEVRRSTRHTSPFWYFKEPKAEPLRWLRDHPNEVELICTGYTFNLLYGTYDFEFMVVVHDPAFCRRFFDDMSGNWESQKIKFISTTKIHRSSNIPLIDLKDLSALIVDEPWAGQGLVSLVEGLHHLRTMSPNRVDDLPFRRLLR